jgi:hypothetical protein
MPTMNLIEENSFSFAKLLVEIARVGIDFALVGGLAVGLNGYPRATLDVDVLALRRILELNSPAP